MELGDRFEIQPTDLVGCRYRLVQRERHPLVPPTPASKQRAERTADARAEVYALLPSQLLRIDAHPNTAAHDTLEALVAGAELITNAEFTGPGWRAPIDVLVRDKAGNYIPVAVSNHRVARPANNAIATVVKTTQLGVAEPQEEAFRLKQHSVDSFRLGFAAYALKELGLGSGVGAAIGQDRQRAFVMPTAPFEKALDKALGVPTPAAPRRLKECQSCRYWFDCKTQLDASDDISLLIPGDRADDYRKRGITTVQGLIDARLGDASALARAWRDGIPVLRRRPEVSAPRFDVEIDIDMEAYLDQGAYLWGTWDGKRYRPFVTWEELGGDAEAENFARFWAWLSAQREAARRRKKSFAAFCYSAHGENHWMLSSARRFGGRRYGGLSVPTEEDVQEFISSGQWLDVFRLVRNQLAGPTGLGLKIVAPLAGFTWAEEDFDGEASVAAYRDATADAEAGDVDKQKLLNYNGDDCRATAAVRAWLAAGAPGTPQL